MSDNQQPTEMHETSAPGTAAQFVADLGDQHEAGLIEQLEQMVTPPVDPAAYDFSYTGEELTAEQAAVDGAVRSWMADAGISREIGNAIAAEANSYAARIAGMTPEQLALETVACMSQLQSIWGDRTTEMVNLARGLVADLDRRHGGRVSEFLELTRLGDSPSLIVQLAHHAQRQQLVAGRRKQGFMRRSMHSGIGK